LLSSKEKDKEIKEMYGDIVYWTEECYLWIEKI
jgi:hypothetical protein